MSNVVINGNTYNGIERIRVASADGGTVDFFDASVYDGILSRGTFSIYDTVTTNVSWCAFIKGSFTANFPNATQVGQQAFMSSTVTELRLPNVESISDTAFANSAKLTKCVLSDKLTSIPREAFYGTGKLATLVLPYDGVVSLANANAFTNSGIASGTGYIYVPSAHVDSYKSADLWSTHANQFRAIEDYPDEVA